MQLGLIANSWSGSVRLGETMQSRMSAMPLPVYVALLRHSWRNSLKNLGIAKPRIKNCRDNQLTGDP